MMVNERTFLNRASHRINRSGGVMERWSGAVPGSILQHSNTPLLHYSVCSSLLLFHRPAIPADDDKAAGKFSFVPRPVALGEQAPGRGELLPATAALGFAGAAAVRVVHRVARHAAVDRPDPSMAGAAGL